MGSRVYTKVPTVNIPLNGCGALTPFIEKVEKKIYGGLRDLPNINIMNELIQFVKCQA